MKVHRRLFRILLHSITVLPIALPLRADEIPWPIQSDRAVTSSFGEPRPGRFHFGVDFSSGGVTGKPVVAIGDGWISRVSTSAFGYGKMLELTLNGGGCAVYGHLSGFLPAIEDTLEAVRFRRHSYEADISFPPRAFPVRKGEVICWSGESGSGPAHLHIELRDAKNRPLNPLDHGLSVNDRIPPEIGDIVFIPLDCESSVDGFPFPQRRSPDSSEPVHLMGRVGVAAEFVDRISPSRYRLGIYRAELAVDTTVVFSKLYDRIPLSHSRFGGMDYLSGRENGAGGTLSALFRREDNPLEIYQGSGLPRILPGDPASAQTIHIRAWDHAGNAAAVSIPAVFGARPVITFCAFSQDGELRVEGNAGSAPLDRIEIETASGEGSKNTRSIPYDGKNLRIIERIPDVSASCQVTLVAWDGSRSIPVTVRRSPVPEGKEAPELTLSTEMYYDRAAVTLVSSEPLASLPVIVYCFEGMTEQAVDVLPAGETAWVAGIPLTGEGKRTLTIMARALDSGLREATVQQTMDLTLATPSKNFTISAPGGGFSLFGARDAVYRPAPASVDTAGMFFPEGLTPASPAYHVEWGDDPVKGPFRVLFHLNAEPPGKALIYASGNGDRWRPLSGQKKGKQFTASFSGSGYVGIFVDEIGPRVEIAAPRPNGTVGPRPTIRAIVEDRESGISGSNSINLIVDGNPVYGEYDPEANTVAYTFRKPLSTGKHEAILGVIDRAGNRVVRRWSFTVK